MGALVNIREITHCILQAPMASIGLHRTLLWNNDQLEMKLTKTMEDITGGNRKKRGDILPNNMYFLTNW